MTHLEELTDEESNFLRKPGEVMLDATDQSKREEAYALFKIRYEGLKKQGKDVSGFKHYLEMYDGASLH